MSPSLSPRTFAARLGWGIVVSCLMVAILALWSLDRSYWNHSINAEVRTQNLSLVLLNDIGHTYEDVDRSLQIVTDDFAHRDSNGRVSRSLLHDRISRILSLHPELAAFRIANAQGDITHGLAGASPTTDSNIRDRPYFRTLRDNPNAGLVMSDPLKGKISGKWGIIFARRLTNADGSFGGVVFANLKLDYFLERFAAINLDSGGSIALRDASLGVIARVPVVGGTTNIGSRKISADFQGSLKNSPAGATYHSPISVDGTPRGTYLPATSGLSLLRKRGSGTLGLSGGLVHGNHGDRRHRQPFLCIHGPRRSRPRPLPSP